MYTRTKVKTEVTTESSAQCPAGPRRGAATHPPAVTLMLNYFQGVGAGREGLKGRYYMAPDNARKCFNCGGNGHNARECIEPKALKICFLCAKPGHEGRGCPNELCFNCDAPGHQARVSRTILLLLSAALSAAHLASFSSEFGGDRSAQSPVGRGWHANCVQSAAI